MAEGGGNLPVSPPQEPDSVALQFHFKPENVSPDMAEVMGQIKQLAEKMLYHWKSFPIILPPSLTQHGEDKGLENYAELFMAPSFDELEQVATDSLGNLKKLSIEQLNSIWDRGEFEVPSVNFPGQSHRWKVTQMLQKGTFYSHDSLLNDSALALLLLIITARNRFASPFFSLSESVKSWGRGAWKILDLLFGMPSTKPDELDVKIPMEHMRYLVAELDIKPSYRQGFSRFCQYVKETSRISTAEKRKTRAFHPPPVPYIYQTPKGMDIDLRLFDKGMINNCLPVLSTILEREARGWYISFRQKMITDLKGIGLSNEEISSRVNEAVTHEYLQRVYKAILANAELESIDPGIGALLVSQAKSVIAMENAISQLKQKLNKHRDDLLAHLKKAYPVKSRIPGWVKEQLQAFEHEFVLQHQWAAHEAAISLCEKEDLYQAVYFLQRDLNFIKQRETILLKELGRVQIPTRVFTFSMRIWMPKNWVTVKNYEGEETVVPTVIAGKCQHQEQEYVQGLSYHTIKNVSRKTTTRYPLWRWYNYLHRSWAWMWNSIFFFGVIVPWCSPFSLRALFCLRPFFPNMEVSRENGMLYKDKNSKTLTFVSRLSAIWDSVRKSRKDFEAAPDRGFLGKSISRHFNRLWNYVVKGFFGSVLLVLTFPVMCVGVSTLSLGMAVAAPVWIPGATLLAHLFSILVYDFDCPGETNKFSILLEALVWRFLIQGVLQPVAAVIIGCLVCPVAALGISIFGITRRSCRGLWDTFIYTAVIKTRARVPASDGFVARRIAGPGLAANYFLQIHPEQALAALEATMESDELECFKTSTLKVIEKPVQNYRNFVEQVFRPFSATIVDDGVFKQLQTETNNYRTDLTKAVNKRLRCLNTGLSRHVQNNAKLTEKQLKMTILQAANMLEAFYPDHVIKLLSVPEKRFWEQQTLEFRDWTGLASQKLSQLFSPSFLVPMEMTDNYFQLKVEHLNLSRYVKMLAQSNVHDDLDIVTKVHSNIVDVSTREPQLDVAYFNPTQKIIDTRRYQTARRGRFPWSRPTLDVVFDKMQVPLPIPHPALIAISIFNRQHEQIALLFDDVFTTSLIRGIKASSNIAEPDTTESLDLEMSTPDNGVEPVSVISHIAEQERSISDDNSTLPFTPLVETTTTVLPTTTPYYEHRVRTYMDENIDDQDMSGRQPRHADIAEADNASVNTANEIGDEIYTTEDDVVVMEKEPALETSI